jgi:hypothetical protein
MLCSFPNEASNEATPPSVSKPTGSGGVACLLEQDDPTGEDDPEPGAPRGGEGEEVEQPSRRRRRRGRPSPVCGWRHAGASATAASFAAKRHGKIAPRWCVVVASNANRCGAPCPVGRMARRTRSAPATVSWIPGRGARPRGPTRPGAPLRNALERLIRGDDRVETSALRWHRRREGCFFIGDRGPRTRRVSQTWGPLL